MVITRPPAAASSCLASPARPAEVVQVPVPSVRFLQAMAENGPGARQERLGTMVPPQGFILYATLSP